MDTYSAMTIQQLSIQFLETLYILDNSKNIETIQSRIQFLESVIERIKPLSNLPDYQFYAQVGIDDYNVRYINRAPTETQLEALLNPHSLDFEASSIRFILHGLNSFINEQYEEINFLKSRASKDKRISKMIHVVFLAKNFLEIKFSTSDAYSNALIEIEKIIKKIKEYHETI
jgi:hypothetical protein